MSVKEAIVVVLDIGLSASKRLENGSSFFDLSKKCLERIIKRKIFASGGDEIALVLLGSEESVNTLGYENISEGFRLANPSWEMLKVVDEISMTDVEKYDWIDALVVAMDVLQTQTEGKKFSGKKIVLIVNPDNDANDDKLEIIVNGIQTLGVELNALGVDLFPEEAEEDEEMDNDYNKNENGNASRTVPDLTGKSRKERGEILLAHIITETGGISCNFEDALSLLKNYQQKVVKPTPWNVLLEISPDLQIPVAAYKKISDPPPSTWKKTLVDTSRKSQDDGALSQAAPFPRPIADSVEVNLDQERIYMRDDQSTVEKEDLITGYYFGSSAVPFNEYDADQMSYKPMGKCLSVLSIVKQEDIPRRLFIGEGIYYIVAQKQRPDTQEALSALIHSLHQQRKAAIVTRIYNKGCYPQLGALFPLIKKRFECLMLVAIPFSEEVNEFLFPPVVSEKDAPKSEELAAVDAFIDAMDLMNVEKDGEEGEVFNLKEVHNPATMREFQNIEHRALHPNEALPPVPEDIKKMFNNIFQSVDSYKSSLSILKDTFNISEQPEMMSLKKKSRFKKGDRPTDSNLSNDPQPSTCTAEKDIAPASDSKDITLIQDTLVEVGTLRPQDDFKALLARGLPFKTVCEQMEKVILNLVLKSFGFESFPKALTALSTLRQSCVEGDPAVYNSWLPKFKDTLYERDRMKFWESVAKDALGLITSEESSSSSISPDAAAELFKEKKERDDDEEMDADALFDEM